MAGIAQGAVDSLLGRLTALLVDEAQMLGGVRGDVEFIKDEMESMNSLLLHLTEAQHRDHQVQAWMKQIVGLARDCEGFAELYNRRIGDPHASQGLLGSLRCILRLLCTVRVRHQVGTRIQELKAQAREVGERRLRYGVTVPSPSAALSDYTYDGAPHPRAAVGEEDDLRRRALLEGEPPGEDEIVRKGIDLLIKRLSGEPPAAAAAAGGGGDPRMRIFSIVSRDGIGARIARGVYQHFSVASSFDCQVWLDQVRCLRSHDVGRVLLLDILKQVTTLQPGQEEELIKESIWDWEYVGKLVTTLREHLKGKRFLIILGDVQASLPGKRIRSALLHADDCPHGSAILVTTLDSRYAFSSSPYEIITVESPVQFFVNRAKKLTNSGYFQIERMREIFYELYPDAFARKMFLHLLYASPNIELKNCHHTIKECKRLNNSIAKQVIIFSYNELPSMYRNCLLYLTIFPKGHIISRTSLARRWIAEGLITGATTSDNIASSTDEAEHYFDVLATRGFVCPVQISAAGDVKSCTVHNEVHEFLTKIAIDVNFVETNLKPDLAHHLSIHNRIGLQEPHSDVNGNDIVAFLPYLAASSQWKLLKVLDLEGCKGLKKQHLKNICKILLLTYLSLRNTDVIELPKQIKELQCLETLDIRQTKVQKLAKKTIVLPLLKHFLAGHKVSASNDANRFEESFSKVHVPLGIQRMKNMEILSHVLVSNSDSELAGIAQLLKLRKLGVTLHGKNAKLKVLFCQVEKLHRRLRSLSIRIDRLAGPENLDAGTVDALPSLPQFIESLNISGVTSGLPYLIQEHHQLGKITLSEANLKKDDIGILGRLHGLCCLRLQHKSYIEKELTIKEDEFQSLKFLLVEGNDVTNISFDIGTAPMLQRIVWSFAIMESLSGVNHLPKLKMLELNGNCNLDSIKVALEEHHNHPELKHNPHHQRHKDRTDVAASSSAP